MKGVAVTEVVTAKTQLQTRKNLNIFVFSQEIGVINVPPIGI